jgi:hypothetical protein
VTTAIRSGSGINYATQRAKTSGYADTLYVGQYKVSGEYEVERMAPLFDSSVVPAGATISAAYIRMFVQAKYDSTGFNCVVQNGQPARPSNPPVGADFDMTFYAGDGGSATVAGLSPGDYIQIDLNATGITWIQTGAGAVTKLMIRSSRDIAGTTPSTKEHVYFYPVNYMTLTVVYVT